MRKLWFALFLLFSLTPANAQSVIPLTQFSIPVSASSAATSQIIAAITSKSIYVTSENFIANGAGNVTLVFGTGFNCVTGQGNLTGVYNLTAQTGLSAGDGTGVVLVAPQSNAVCLTTTTTAVIAGSISYAQF